MLNGYDMLLIVLAIWNIITFILIGIDKRRAIKRRYRIPEKTLLLYAFLFGSIGIMAGMYIFRHKTRHKSFNVLVPLALLFNFALFYLILYLN